MGNFQLLKTESLQQLCALMCAFLKLGFFVSGVIRLELGVTMSIIFHNIHTYRHEMVISFANISGSNGPILMKFIQLIHQMVWSLNINFHTILIIL